MTESKVRVFLKQYWTHYIMLEEEVMKTTDYVSINRVNFETFSVRYFMLFEMICSEVDALCKGLIKEFDLPLDEERMDCYAAPICEKYPDFTKRKIRCIGHDIELNPWNKWGDSYNSNAKKRISTPNWWKDYNACKHDRTATRTGKTKANYMYANQKNVLCALSALYQLNMYCFRELRNDDPNYLPDMPNPPSKLFEVIDWGNKWVTVGQGMALRRVE